jgi:hypothetical protein
MAMFEAMRTTALAAAFTLVAATASAQDTNSVPSPMTLLRRSPSEPSWAATLRLRDAESRYRPNPQWRSAYCQLRAQSEIWLGDQAAALREIGRCWGDWGVGPYTVPAGTRATDAVALIASAAETARVVMVNERHHVTSDRLLTLKLLPVLWQKGYRYFAAEAFDSGDSSINTRPYAASGVTGGYVDEPVFGEIVREARRLGYTLVAYEMEPGQDTSADGLSSQQRRDRAQARNLNDRVFRTDPTAKVLVHAGYAHIKEHADSTWSPMAAYLRELTGIDPVTVDQTMLGEMSEPAKEHPAYRAAQSAGLVGKIPVILVDRGGHPISPAAFDVDFQVLTPRTTYVRGRPSWMMLGTRRRAVTVAVPECAARQCIIEARLASDGADAVPIDRTEARTGSVMLYLPPDQRVKIRVLSTTNEVLRDVDSDFQRSKGSESGVRVGGQIWGSESGL